MAAPSTQASFLITYRQSQPWSLPDSLIYYITKNPSTPKCYEKMIQSCKHFFIKNPILIIPYLYCNNENHEWHTKLVNLKNLTNKIWIREKLTFSNHIFALQTSFSFIIPKIYRSKCITFHHQNIFFNDLILLASKCERLWLNCATIVKKNGNIVALEEIIEVLPALKILTVHLIRNATKIITSNTVSKLLQIPNFLKLHRFVVIGIKESFDINTFFSHIKKNKETEINIQFDDDISEEYKARLQAIVDEIIATKNHNYKPPYIFFPEITHSSHNSLRDLRY